MLLVPLPKGPHYISTQAEEAGACKKSKVMYPYSCSAEWVTPLKSHLWGPQPPPFPLRGQSQFPDSLVEVLTWLWAAVWGREAGQMSRSPGEEAAPREGGQGFWPGKTTSSPSDLALSVWSWGATTGPS